MHQMNDSFKDFGVHIGCNAMPKIKDMPGVAIVEMEDLKDFFFDGGPWGGKYPWI